MELALGIFGMALAWRIRGGWLGVPSSTAGRLIPASLLCLMALHITGHDPWMLMVLPLMWLGAIPAWAQWQDMGRVEDNDDFVGMTGRGLLLTWPVGLFLYLYGLPPWFSFGGVLMGPIYWLAWRFFGRVRRGGFIDGPGAIAEMGVGAMLATLFYLTIGG